MTGPNSIKILFSILLFILISNNLSAQTMEVTVEQDEKIALLLREKIKSNASSNVNERYRIQIFSRDNLNSRKLLTEFKNNYDDIDATIIFQTPNYKVLIGSFFNRIEANRYLQKMKAIYPNSFIIKPNK